MESSGNEVKGLKIAYSPDLDYFPVDAEVRRNLEETVAALRDAGAQVERVELGWTERVHQVALQHYAHYYGNEPRMRYATMPIC